MTEIELILNGEPFALPSGSTVADLVSALALPGDGRGVAVALDGVVVARSEWSAVRLALNNRVEVVIATQGG